MAGDSTEKIRKEINDIKLGEITSPAESALLDICDRLARRIAALERELSLLDRATANARARTARF